MKTRRYIALDTETTGVTNEDRIIDIYAVFVDPHTGDTGQSFSLRCNPQRPSHPRAYEKHRIHDDELRNAPLFAHHAKELLQFLSGSCIIAHNVKFDSRMLRLEFERIAPALLEEHNILFSCSMLAAQEILGRKAWPSLDLLCDTFEIDRSARDAKHAAQLDVELLTRVLPRLHHAYRHKPKDDSEKSEDTVVRHSDIIFGNVHA